MCKKKTKTNFSLAIFHNIELLLWLVSVSAIFYLFIDHLIYVKILLVFLTFADESSISIFAPRHINTPVGGTIDTF